MTPTSGHTLLLAIGTRVQVDPVSGCWLWTGAHSQSGWRGVFYPILRVGGRRPRGRVYRLNRLVLMLACGPAEHPRIPAEPFLAYLERLRLAYQGLEASHTCDNAKCVHPDHLGWKGHQENLQEQVARRRALREAREALGPVEVGSAL